MKTQSFSFDKHLYFFMIKESSNKQESQSPWSVSRPTKNKIVTEVTKLLIFFTKAFVKAFEGA